MLNGRLARPLAVIAVGLGSAGAWAQCPGATNTPFGVDDSGVVTCNKAASICEQKVGSQVRSLVGQITTCHFKQARATLSGAPVDDEACEMTAINRFVGKAKVTSCPCVNPAGIAGSVETFLDTFNFLSYCKGWDPITSTCVPPNIAIDTTGEDSGCVDPTARRVEFKCAEVTSRCFGTMVRGWIKCHSTYGGDFLKNKTFDEDACENGLVGTYNSCLAKIQHTLRGACDPCEAANAPIVAALIKAQVDGANNQLWCMSPGGAFVQ
jgi:hypothetical protein